MACCGGSFIPRTLDDFIGRQIIRAAERRYVDWRAAHRGTVGQGVQLVNANQRSPFKYLSNGRPGLGKSALVAHLQQLLLQQVDTIKPNGTQCKVETIEEIARQLACTCLSATGAFL